MQKLGSCTPRDLVTLVPWTGPAFGDDGKLLAPLPAGHVEAVVNGWEKRDAQATKLREMHGMLAAADVFTRPGLLGFEKAPRTARRQRGETQKISSVRDARIGIPHRTDEPLGQVFDTRHPPPRI